MTTTTTPTITNQQIRQLRAEAASAGDQVQVYLCDRALQGDKTSIRACALAIAEATRNG